MALTCTVSPVRVRAEASQLPPEVRVTGEVVQVTASATSSLSVNTVTLSDADEPATAVMRAVPEATAVTRPELFTVATDGFDVVHDVTGTGP